MHVLYYRKLILLLTKAFKESRSLVQSLGPLQMTLSVQYAMPLHAVLVAINTWSSGMSIKDPSNGYVGTVKRPLWRYCVVSVSRGGSKEIAVFAAK